MAVKQTGYGLRQGSYCWQSFCVFDKLLMSSLFCCIYRLWALLMLWALLLWSTLCRGQWGRERCRKALCSNHFYPFFPEEIHFHIPLSSLVPLLDALRWEMDMDVQANKCRLTVCYVIDRLFHLSIFSNSVQSLSSLSRYIFHDPASRLFHHPALIEHAVPRWSYLPISRRSTTFSHFSHFKHILDK